jgi:hypothetical protein
MEQNPHLTQGFSERIESLIARTPKGMAHWSGTASDPAATCLTCAEFVKNATNKRGYCAKFARLNQLKTLIKFDGTVHACLHWRAARVQP